MATTAHCAYVFECLAAKFDRRQPLGLAQVEELWAEYHADDDDVEAGNEDEEAEDDAEMTDADAEGEAPRPAAISRLLNKDRSATSSSSSLPSTSTRSATSSSQSQREASGTATPASSTSSSRTSLFSFGKKKQQQRREAHPLFVTWNTLSRSGYKSLRGCIGTFEAQELEAGLKSYALTSAFEDVRFQPIPASLLPSLSTDVTLLTNFSMPTTDSMGWTLGTHGIRISFSQNGRRFGATYLPDVAKEQGWTKEETLISLMRKAGWNGSSSAWQRVWQDGRGELVRYEGKKKGLGYAEWKRWRDWVDAEGVKSRDLN